MSWPWEGMPLLKRRYGRFYSQWDNTYESMKPVVDMIAEGYDFVITHGNGPQVGALMLMVDKSRDDLPETPLGVADAMTEGSMGYMLDRISRT